MENDVSGLFGAAIGMNSLRWALGAMRQILSVACWALNVECLVMSVE